MESPRRSRKWRWIVGFFLVLAAVAVIGIRVMIRRAQPILRARVIETLKTRFKSRVELAELHVWVADGLHVEGKGLQVYGTSDPNPWEPGVQPLLEVGEFRFQTSLPSLFREPMHVDTVYASGLIVNIPPRSNQQMKELKLGGRKMKMKIFVDHFVCANTRLVINTDKAGKPPLEFDIRDLRMKDIGPGQPLRFDAKLINPKPQGDIHSTGQFGPLNEKSPRDTAVMGDYSFTHADLGAFAGIGGILSSTGKYGGTLGRIEVEGQTDTPDFRLAVSGHRVPLHTDFHAIVDGTDGDTYLNPVRAKVLNSHFAARGKIVRIENPRGHDIELDVTLDGAHIEDLLKLAVKTDPPIMTGSITMKTSLKIPPGTQDVADRLNLQGNFRIPAAHFSNPKIQNRIDELSRVSQGVKHESPGQTDKVVSSDLMGRFALSQGVLTFSYLHFLVPGTHADLTGQYSLDGNTFNFHGTLRLNAKLSQMTTGWKSKLLWPFDPLFQKNGAGTEIPFKISGTREAPHFGLDLHSKDEFKGEEHLPEAHRQSNSAQ